MAVLYLDVDDEITSAAARIRAIDDDRVAVVLPFGSRLATSRINFRLLAHEATVHGKTIEVIAADASARALAMTAGLTVHPSVAAFEGGGAGDAAAGAAAVDGRGSAVVVSPGDATTVMPAVDAGEPQSGVIIVPRARREPVPVVGRVRPPVRPGVAAGIALGTLAFIVVAGVLGFMLLPSATIVLSPWSREIGPQRVQVLADPTVTAADPIALTMPAQRFTFPIAVQQTFKATGVRVTDVKATGTVEFSNLDTGRGVFVPKGTIVRTKAKVEFTTVADLTIQRATYDITLQLHPAKGSVGVEAVEAGPGGNVARDTITIIPRGGSNLKVTNPDPTTGGAHDEATVVSQNDVDKALATLNAAIPPELDRQIAAAVVPSGTTLYPETKVVGTAAPSVDPKTLVGTEATQFDLGLTAEGSILGVDAAPVQALADARLRSEVEAGWDLADGSVQIEVGNPTIVGDRVTFPVTLAAREVRHVDEATLLAQIKGLDIPAARARLDDYGSVDVRVWPDWVTTIPASDRTTLTVGDPVPEPSPSP